MLTENTSREESDTTQVEPRGQELILAVTRVNLATRVCAALGDAQMFAHLAQYYALVANEIASAEGQVIKVMGDSTLLTFPPSHPSEAVEALHMLLTKANTLWQQIDDRCQVQVKVGIGRVVSGMLGPPGGQRLDIIGTALNCLFKAPWGEFEVMPELARLLN
jgi:class 3 adenylate cyclase